jgi:hypothetical protein
MSLKNLIVAIASLFFFVACNKSDDNNITASAVTSTVTTGGWRVTYYWDTDHEETSNFTGYTFTFGSAGVLTAVNGGTTVTGTWAAGTDDSKAKLIITFATPSNFAELSEDWHVIERTDTKVRMQHVSGGNGGTDYLTLEKI